MDISDLSFGNSTASTLEPASKRPKYFQEKAQSFINTQDSYRNYHPKMVRKYYKARRRFYSRGQSDAARAAQDARIMEQFSPSTARGSEKSIDKYGLSWSLANPAQKAARYTTGFKGHGDYNSTIKPFMQRWIPKGSLAALGGWGGSWLGGAQGGTLGSSIGSSAANYLGWGKYRKNYKGRGDYGGSAGGNQIIAGSVDTPITVNASDDLTGDIYISHREFLQNVTASTGAGVTISPFQNTTFPINVGMTETFPWLAQIAQNFTLYQLQGLIFEFKPTSGEFGVTGNNSLGKVVMATQYDPDAPNFVSTVQMENYDYANACKPSEHMLHGVETASSQTAVKMFYIRTGASPKDKIFTDYGTFNLATEGIPLSASTTSNIGELWVTYRVKLSRAQLYSSLLGRSIQSDVHYGVTAIGGTINGNTSSTSVIAVLGATKAAKYNLSTIATNTAVAKTNNSLGGAWTGFSTTHTVYTFPPNIVDGTYQVTVYLHGTNAVDTPNGDNVNIAANLYTTKLETGIQTSLNSYPTALAGSGVLVSTAFITVKAPGNLVALINIDLNAAWAGATYEGQLFVTQVPDILVA